jgi:hypothetical protein
MSGYGVPYWVKLSKAGTIYSAFMSPDAISWTQVGSSVDLGFGATNSNAGFAVTSHNNAVLSTATFDNFNTSTVSSSVQLLTFTGQNINNKYILLQWSTQSEIFNDHFEVERSADGVSNFQTIATVPGAGTSVVAQNYSAQDNNPLQGLNYYRLKYVDKNGNATYSANILVRFDSSPGPIVFPNPAGSLITILQGQETIKDITIYNVLGQRLGFIANSASLQSLPVAVNSLAAGVYIIKINTSTHSYLQKLIRK